MSDLQRLTDQLAERVERSVAIDDPHMRLQSYSPHYGAVDEQRLASILHRQANPEAIEWAFAHGVQKATTWLRLPASPERGMMSRVCVPVRFAEIHLGYLWLIDPDDSMTADDLALATVAAEQAAEIMYRESLASDLQHSRERELLRDLLDDAPAVREQAVAGLAEEALFDVTRPIVALVLGVHNPRDSLDSADPAASSDRLGAADIALTQVRRLVPIRHSIHLVRPDHAILVVALDRDIHAPALGTRLKATYDRYSVSQTARIGIGTSMQNVRDTHLSYRQARTAARVGAALALGDVLSWLDLGVYRLLAELTPEQISDQVLYRGLANLAAHDDGDQLIDTLETFLDSAGDVRIAAEKLFLHRSSLYHRLTRIEEIAEIDLKSGLDRLDLHLGVKLLRLTGRPNRP